jgi:ABC-type nitrate/sulfonate/bicarbonate transport system permease component
MNRSRRLALSFGSVATALLLWELGSRSSTERLIPPPSDVFDTFVAMTATGELLNAVGQSLLRVLVGYGAGVAAGVLTGLALGSVRALDRTLGILFEFVKGIPPIAIVPIVIMWLGIGEVSKYVVVAYIVWIIVTISTAVGAREIPKVRVRMGMVMRLSMLQQFRWIVLPSALPYVLAGMRSGLGFAFVGLVSAELIAANSGIGQIIMDARFALETSRMLVGLIVLGLLGASIQVGFDALVRHPFIRRRLFGAVRA